MPKTVNDIREVGAGGTDMVTKSSQNDATRYTSYSPIAASVEQVWSDGAGDISVYIDHADIQNVRMEIYKVVALIHITPVNALKLADALTAAASRLLIEQQEVKSDAEQQEVKSDAKNGE